MDVSGSMCIIMPWVQGGGGDWLALMFRVTDLSEHLFKTGARVSASAFFFVDGPNCSGTFKTLKVKTLDLVK